MPSDIDLDVLSRMPCEPDSIDTTTLRNRLGAAGIHVTRRRLERTLERLEQAGYLACNNQTKPFRWSWRANQYIEFPPMNADTALSVVLADEYLRQALPPHAIDDLKPRVRRAKQLLARHPQYKNWKAKVRIISKGQAMIPPSVNVGVLKAVNQALFDGLQFTVEYRMRGKSDYKQFDVNPLGLLVRDGILSLVSTRSNTNHLQQLQLHRMRNPELTNNKVRIPPGFNFADYVQQGNVQYKLTAGPVAIELLVDKVVADTLSESRLSANQVIEPEADGRFRVGATVADTLDLRGWSKSYGPLVEVAGPPVLRDQIAGEIRKASELYAR